MISRLVHAAKPSRRRLSGTHQFARRRAVRGQTPVPCRPVPRWATTRHRPTGARRVPLRIPRLSIRSKKPGVPRSPLRPLAARLDQSKWSPLFRRRTETPKKECTGPLDGAHALSPHTSCARVPMSRLSTPLPSHYYTPTRIKGQCHRPVGAERSFSITTQAVRRRFNGWLFSPNDSRIQQSVDANGRFRANAMRTGVCLRYRPHSDAGGADPFLAGLPCLRTASPYTESRSSVGPGTQQSVRAWASNPRKVLK